MDIRALLWNEHVRQGLRSGLFYGVGMLVGTAVTSFLYNQINLSAVGVETAAVRLVLGVLLAFALAAFGAFFAGALGGWSLDTVGERNGRFGYAWRSGFTMAPFYGFMLYPLVFIISLLSLYTEIEAAGLQYGLLVAVLGLLFGALYGVMLAIFTVGSGFIGRVTWNSAVGFMIGGLFLGYMSWLALRNTSLGEFSTIAPAWFTLGAFVFGFCGGGLLGREYSILRAEEGRESFTRQRWLTWRKGIVLTAVLLLLVWTIRPVMQTLAQTLQPVDANLATRLGNEATTTHWSDSFAVSEWAGSENVLASDVAVNGAGQVAVVWEADDGIYVATGLWGSDNATTWADPLQVAPTGSDPRVVVDGSGLAHLVWEQDGLIHYVACEARGCDEPRSLSNASNLACDGAASAPALAVTERGGVFVTWQTAVGAPYAIWPEDGIPPGIPAACLPLENPTDLDAATGANGIRVVAASGPQVVTTELPSNGEWTAPVVVGDGQHPAVWVAGESTAVAYCSADAQPVLWRDGATSVVSTLPCRAGTQVALDGQGALHVIWASDAVANGFGTLNPYAVVYEAIEDGAGWSEPTIVANPMAVVETAVVASPLGALFMTWPDAGGAQYASRIPYSCDEPPDGPIMQVMLDLAESPEFRPEGDAVPYCGNRYDGLVFTPGPQPAFSDQEPTLNGAFDVMADMIRAAEYEALFATMWYDGDQGDDSPGAVVMSGVADLYEKVKANPENYPRGMTVRILLGNPPEFARGEFAGQLWHVLDDLRDAGVDRMVDRELGWSVEVADYEGALPHSHTKVLVVDGKTAVAAGYNMSYAHFWKDHPSGLGESRFDLGIHMTGPIAQDALRMFDDLWDGATRRHCANFYPLIAEAWQATCGDFTAQVTHVPEVLRYYLPDANSNAFSMYRSHAYDLADKQVAAALGAAQESIDAIHVNFTMEMICDLNLFFDVCTFEEVMPYTRSIVEAMDQNGVRARILVKPFPVDGIESSFNLDVLNQEIEARGLEELIEVRLFDGEMHTKSALIDGSVLIIGSQNYHYSAFGEGSGLNEYNMGTDDPQAAEDYQRVFDYYWERALTTDIDGQ